jgi:Carboxypeptidase regulatory-like domain
VAPQPVLVVVFPGHGKINISLGGSMRVLSVKLGIVLLFTIWLSALPVWAQSINTGTVGGTITDPSGAVVSSAKVTLTDRATNSARTTSTNEVGHYFFANINPGEYDLTVSKPGFETTKSSSQVQVGLATTMNLTLQIGATTTTVEVETAGTELQMMNATVGNTINSVAMDALPSLGRDVSTFIELQPGVSPDGAVAGAENDQNYFSLDGGNNTNDMDGNMSIYTTSFAGDPTGGVASQTLATAGPTGVLPTPQDSVEEFKVNSAGQTADFNSSAGAEIKVVTRRGTNAWHGTAYEYYRDNNWSANLWDNNYAQALQQEAGQVPTAGLLPSFHYSRFGAAIGGPLIPKDVLGGKTYFFANYEGFRFPESQTIQRDIPSPLMRLGLLTDPSTGTVYNLNPNAVTYNGKTYAGTGTTVDPRGLGLNPEVSQIWQKYMPQSNASCNGRNVLCDSANILGFSGNLSTPQSSNFGVARLDHDFSPKWHFMSSYRYYNLSLATTDQVDIGGFFPGDTLGTPSSQSKLPQQPWYLVAGITTNVTPNTTNDFHYSFLRNWWAWKRAGDTIQLPGLGGALEIQSGESPQEDLSPYNVNTQQTRTRFWDGHDQSFRDDVSMLKGNHLFQFGGIYQHNWDWHQRTDNGGGINYQPVYELGQGVNGAGQVSIPFCNNPAFVQDGFSTSCGADYSAILGIVSQSQIAYTRSGPNLQLNPPLTPAFDQSTIPYYNVYFSDTWHLKPTFTLTYGLGWALEMPPTEAQGKQVELVDQADQPISETAFMKRREAAALQGQVYNPEIGFATVGNTANGLKYPYNPFYGEFSPRIAAAWNPQFDSDSIAGKIFGHEDTVVRGGYGRIYGRLNGVALVLAPLLGSGLIQPSVCVNNIMNGTCGAAFTATAANAFRVGPDGMTAPIPVPSATLPQPQYPGVNSIAAGGSLEALDPHFRPNSIDSFDLTIQRQLSRKMTLELGYIGRRITNEFIPINLNSVPTMMTLGGQSFANAYKNVELALGCASGPTCTTTTAPTSMAAQPFFESALSGTGYCTGYANCTSALVAKNFNLLSQQDVWSLWSGLDQGGVKCSGTNTGCGFNFPRSMMNSPLNCPPGNTTAIGCGGQLTSGVVVNSSQGWGNYNAGFASLKTSDWKGLTLQQNFTFSKALGTTTIYQAVSSFSPDNPFDLDTNYGLQSFNRKFVYNTFLVYQPPYFKGQSGLMGHLLGGWTFAPVFTAGSGNPFELNVTNGDGQEFGGQDAVSIADQANAIQIGPVAGEGHAHYFPQGLPTGTPGSGGLPVSIFSNPSAAYAQFRNPILGLDYRDGGFGSITGLPYWNLDFSIRKNIRVTEGVALEFQGVFTNVLNHAQQLDPINSSLALPSAFGNLEGQTTASGWLPRAIELGARVRF